MADGLSRGDAARSSKLRLLNIMQNGTRVGLSCVCVCAGIHCHLAGYTATLSKIGSYHNCHLSGHWATMPPRWGVWARLPSEGALIAARVPGGTGGSGEGGAGNKGERRLLSAVYHVIHRR